MDLSKNKKRAQRRALHQKHKKRRKDYVESERTYKEHGKRPNMQKLLEMVEEGGIRPEWNGSRNMQARRRKNRRKLPLLEPRGEEE